MSASRGAEDRHTSPRVIGILRQSPSTKTCLCICVKRFFCSTVCFQDFYEVRWPSPWSEVNHDYFNHEELCLSSYLSRDCILLTYTTTNQRNLFPKPNPNHHRSSSRLREQKNTNNWKEKLWFWLVFIEFLHKSWVKQDRPLYWEAFYKMDPLIPTQVHKISRLGALGFNLLTIFLSF